MKIFRWILSNILLLVVVWTLVYVYLNWDEVKDDMPESVTNLVARFQQGTGDITDADAKQAQADESLAQQAPIETTVAPDQSELVEELLGVEETVVADTAALSSEGELTEQQVSTEVTEQQVPTEVAILTETTVDEVVEDPVAAAPEPAEVAPAVVPEGIAAARPVENHDLDQQVRNELIQAREAFWHRDLAKAEQLYGDLAGKQSDNPDIWGELGNVYLAQNKVKEAADAYYKAAEILIEEGRLRQVGQLMGVIQMAEPAKAQALDQKIRELYQQTGAVR